MIATDIAPKRDELTAQDDHLSEQSDDDVPFKRRLTRNAALRALFVFTFLDLN